MNDAKNLKQFFEKSDNKHEAKAAGYIAGSTTMLNRRL